MQKHDIPGEAATIGKRQAYSFVLEKCLHYVRRQEMGQSSSEEGKTLAIKVYPDLFSKSLGQRYKFGSLSLFNFRPYFAYMYKRLFEMLLVFPVGKTLLLIPGTYKLQINKHYVACLSAVYRLQQFLGFAPLIVRAVLGQLSQT